MDFESFIKDIKLNNLKVHGVEVYDKGHLIHSYGDTVNNKYPIYSATKTILSIAAGIAMDEGKFHIERSIMDYIPLDIKKQLSDHQKNSFDKITVERLMTMSVKGLPFRPEGESYLKYSLSCEIKDEEKKSFCYSNISAYLVGVALTNSIGEDLHNYINRKILVPLNINEARYGRCPEGYFYGASGMELSVNDLSKIGLLLYNEGMFNGKRLLSKDYVNKATSVQQMNKEGGYGYFIWKYKEGFSINGKWGQKCYVLPDKGMIITFLSNIEDRSKLLKESMEKNLIVDK